MSWNPSEGMILVDPIKADDKSKGGIVLPEQAKEKSNRGKVVAVGPGRTLENGERRLVPITIGNEVMYPKNAGLEVEVDGKELLFLRDVEVIAWKAK